MVLAKERKPITASILQSEIKWKNFALFAVTYLLFGMAIGVILSIYDSFNKVKIMPLIMKGSNSLISDAIIFIIALSFYKPLIAFIKPLFDFSVFKQRRTYGIIIGSLILIYILQYFTLDLFNIESAGLQQKNLGLVTDKSNLVTASMLFLSTVLLTPIKEEILFRGMICSLFTQKWNAILGILLSSIIFGLLHEGVPITASLMGVIFALNFKMTKSLIPGMVVHVIWNFIVLFT